MKDKRDTSPRGLAIDAAMRSLADALSMPPDDRPAERLTRGDAYSIGMSAWDAIVGDALGTNEEGEVVRGTFKHALGAAIQRQLALKLAEDMVGLKVDPKLGDHSHLFGLVVIESPFAANAGRSVEDHIRYARRCVRDSFSRHEFPYASHLLYTQEGILDDTIPAERKLGMTAGFVWGELASLTAVYTDCGISRGMEMGIERAKKANRRVEYRELGAWK